METDIVALANRLPYPLPLAGLMLIAGFLFTKLAFQDRPLGRFLCQVATMSAFTVMLAIAGVVPFKPTPVMALSLVYLMISFFKAIWWLAVAWLAAGFVRAALVFKRKPLETRFLQDLCAGAIYLGGLLGVIAYVFDVPVSGLLAASGVIAIVLGLALQSTLSDVFSGVALNLARPYHPGDWIMLDGGVAGRVTETNWRATYLLTDTEDLAIVPNSIIAKSRIINASRPTSPHGIKLTVRLDPTMSPLSAVAVLETALLSCTHILRVPIADVMVQSLDATALQCELTVFVSDIEEVTDARNEVFDRVFRHSLAAGMRMAPPPGSPISLPRQDTPLDADNIPRQMLERLPIFATLSAEERTTLIPKITSRTYQAGEVVVDAGIVCPALFILTAGVLAAFQQYPGGEAEILRLAPGDCFGQGSVLSGAATAFKVTALSRAVVYEIAKDDMAPILQKRPAIAAELGRIMARREAAGRRQLNALEKGSAADDTSNLPLADRFMRLFGGRA